MNNIIDQNLKPAKNRWKTFAKISFVLAIIIFIISVFVTFIVLSNNNACTHFIDYSEPGCMVDNSLLCLSVFNIIYTLIYGLVLFRKIKTTISTGLSRPGKFSLIFFSLYIYIYSIFPIIFLCYLNVMGYY